VASAQPLAKNRIGGESFKVGTNENGSVCGRWLSIGI
jgi:hypothetical protein